MNQTWKLALSGALLAALLVGCSSNSESGTGSEDAASAATASASADNGQAAEGANPKQMERGTFGKIKSVDGNSITVYTSSFTGGRGGGQDGGQPPQGEAAEGDAGTMPSGAPDEATGKAPQDGQPGQGGGMNMEDMFTDETVTLQITDSTTIVERTFENNEMKETELTASDLKADDIITYTLVDGSEDQVASISIGMGGFGGGPGGGMKQGGQQGDQGQTTTDTDTEASAG